MAAVGVGVWELSVCLSDSGEGGGGLYTARLPPTLRYIL